MKEKAPSEILNRSDKILLVLYDLSGGTTKKLHFEDLVVALLKKYPGDFALKGYPEYPDSEGVSKEFYRGKTMKNSGLINYSNRIFSLTDRGLSYVENIRKAKTNLSSSSAKTLSRFAEKEIDRIASTEGFGLFSMNEPQKISDTDFFNYLGITPRTSKGDFEGRIGTIEQLIKEIKKQIDIPPLHEKLIAYHNFLINEKFTNIVDYYRATK